MFSAFIITEMLQERYMTEVCGGDGSELSLGNRCKSGTGEDVDGGEVIKIMTELEESAAW